MALWGVGEREDETGLDRKQDIELIPHTHTHTHSELTHSDIEK